MSRPNEMIPNHAMKPPGIYYSGLVRHALANEGIVLTDHVIEPPSNGRVGFGLGTGQMALRPALVAA